MAPWDEPGRLDAARALVRGSPALKAFCLRPEGLQVGALPPSEARAPGVYYVDRTRPELVAAVTTLTRLLWAWAPVPGYGAAGVRYAARRALRTSEPTQEAWRAWRATHGGGWAWIEGTEGTGKTSLAYAFLVAAATFGGTISVVTSKDVKELSYREGSAGDGSAWEAKLAELRRARIVYLDDVGYSIRDRLQDWQAERWEEVIRLLADAGTPVLGTTNHSLAGGPSPLAEQIGRRACQIIVEHTAPRYAGDRRRFTFAWPSGRGGVHA